MCKDIIYRAWNMNCKGTVSRARATVISKGECRTPEQNIDGLYHTLSVGSQLRSRFVIMREAKRSKHGQYLKRS